MTNIERRLSKAEAQAAKTTNVMVRYAVATQDETEMDLLKAAQLMTERKIISIGLILTDEEKRKCLTETQREIEDYVNQND